MNSATRSSRLAGRLMQPSRRPQFEELRATRVSGNARARSPLDLISMTRVTLVSKAETNARYDKIENLLMAGRSSPRRRDECTLEPGSRRWLR